MKTGNLLFFHSLIRFHRFKINRIYLHFPFPFRFNQLFCLKKAPIQSWCCSLFCVFQVGWNSPTISIIWIIFLNLKVIKGKKLKKNTFYCFSQCFWNVMFWITLRHQTGKIILKNFWTLIDECFKKKFMKKFLENWDLRLENFTWNQKLAWNWNGMKKVCLSDWQSKKLVLKQILNQRYAFWILQSTLKYPSELKTRPEN